MKTGLKTAIWAVALAAAPFAYAWALGEHREMVAAEYELPPLTKVEIGTTPGEVLHPVAE